jgi:hypothetical protein
MEDEIIMIYSDRSIPRQIPVSVLLLSDMISLEGFLPLFM